MPSLFLSPSSQEFNPTAIGQSEEYYMNLIADAMEPYLRSSGVTVTRNSRENTAGGHIAQSGAGQYDFHLALHSNAAGSGGAGQVRGTDVYYYPTSAQGQRMAELLVARLREIYPLPDRVRAISTTSLGEVARTRAPAVLIEYAYHDNLQDANWIADNIESIAQATVRAVTEYFGLPFVSPITERSGMVSVDGPVPLRGWPTETADAVAELFRGDAVTVVGQWMSWLTVETASGQLGFLPREFVSF